MTKFKEHKCGDVMKDYDPPAMWIPLVCPGTVGRGGCRLATDCSIPCPAGCAKHKYCEWRGGACKNKITKAPTTKPTAAVG